MKLLSVIFFQPLAALLMPGRWVWPHFAGAALLIIGLTKITKINALQIRATDRVAVFGPLFFAIPMAVFAADHFISPQIVAAIVPSWIPGHLFWVYFVGVALFAAALSIVTRKHSVLAATLLSAMLFSFVLLIHVPNLAANPRNRFALAVLLRDSSFSAGALACAVVQAEGWPKRSLNRILILVRYIIGVPAVVFGVEHFLHPEFVPVVPLKQLMPSWIPGHLPLAYVTGVVLIASGFCILLNWKARLAATWLGIFVFVVVLLVYLPITVAKISDIGNGLNYLADTLAYGGTALLLARALPVEDHSKVPLEKRRESIIQAGIFQSSDT
jgi:uncharacterized membrane protein